MWLTVSALLLACIVPGGKTDKVDETDSDKDGLTDVEEKKLGSDPNSADSDGDGLGDLDESNMGTDLNAEDTDNDGYTDLEESMAGSDPVDAESVIYAGGWPFNADKDSMEEGDPNEGRIRVGTSIVPHFKLMDQFGEEVDIYDFAQQGKPMIIDLSGAWCYWCNEAAKLLSGRRNSALAGYGMDDLHEAVTNGDFYWITVLDADYTDYNTPPTEDTLAGWYSDYPEKEVPVLMDDNWEVRDWIGPKGWPTMMYVDENMVVSKYDAGDYTVAILAALADAGY